MLCLIIFWGSSFVVVKTLLSQGLTPIAIATFRFLVAGALFLVALLVQKVRRPLRSAVFERRDTLTFIGLSLLGVTFFFIAQYVGIELADASVAAILVCLLSPILIALFSIRIFSEALTRRQFLGLAVAGIGTLVVITGGTMNLRSSDPTFLVGSLILLLTPILWASYTLGGKKLTDKYSPFLVVAYVNIIGGLFLIPFSLAENSLQRIMSLSLQAWAAILYLAVTCSFVGYFIWFYVMNRVRAAVTSSFLFAEPLVTVLFATAFIGETITPLILAGGLLIFTGVLLITRK
ncbi:MAG TPA: EamA family transporter [Candidatus Limnocylindrales bacterium]|nr:EamA family transporter [Candidatus Limnocylindrales bacterium]